MTLTSFHQTRETLKQTPNAEDRIRILVSGARAAVSQNAIFSSDLRIAIEWLTEAKQLLESLTFPAKVSKLH